MVYRKNRHLAREDWLQAALELCEEGIDEIKITPLATRLGVTSGSFYWHFKNRRELLDALFVFWEQESTDGLRCATEAFEGAPLERIRFFIDDIMKHRLARYDYAIWHWAQSRADTKELFQRVLHKRTALASSLFLEAGFPKEQAETRGRMLVLCIMGELALNPDAETRHRDLCCLQYGVLTNPCPSDVIEDTRDRRNGGS